MDFPRNAEDARDHISLIRQERGLGSSKSHIKDLEAALTLLSEQLYQNSTRFLLELVQNADDNAYGSSLPTLNLRYKDRYLSISCNEVGFSKKDVEAICRIGRSTKSKHDRYIGEQGIGFKSVFKVADVAWIKSGYYSFKFDKSEALGMLTPIWADIPNAALALAGHTTIFLQLSMDYNEAELLAYMKKFDPRVLVFLRKLERLNMSITGPSGHEWSTSIARHDRMGSMDGQEYVSLQKDNTSQQYIIIRHSVQNLSPDPKRPGCSHSQLSLGFPVSSDRSPVLTSQYVYSFLPIRDYGFKFLIQGDFLLTANREDIDNSCSWNRSLLHALPDAVFGAIQQFNKGPMRYTWLQFFKEQPHLAGIFVEVESSMVHLLSKQPILESAAGVFSSPAELFRVPNEFLSSQGLPLLMCDSFRGKYLSPRYSVEDWPKLRRLGVCQQSTEGFLSDLDFLITHCPDDFRRRPDHWHSSLGQALSTIIATHNPSHRETIARMQFIRLRNGEWVASTAGILVFANEQVGLEIPHGVEILEVHPESSQDSPRRQLLLQLGVQAFNPLQVCTAIAKAHASLSFRPATLSHAHLVSQALFLYHARWRNVRRQPLWFAAQDGTYAYGHELYVKSTAKLAAADWPEGFGARMRLLHEEYFSWLKDSATRDEWIDWLVSCYEVNIFPIMVTPGHSQSFFLSDDFRALIKVSPSSKILELLKLQWDHYSKWIERADALDKADSWETSRKKLVDELASMKVNCRGGYHAPLNSTILPLKDLPESRSPQLPLLDVDDPDDPGWKFLQNFGVGVTIGTRIFIDQLVAARDTKVRIEDVSRIYSELEIRKPTHEELRLAFAQERLIFIPPESTDSIGIWVNLNSCIWDGPQILRKTAYLKNYYPSLRELFQGILRIKDADVSTLVKEALMINTLDSLEYISEILVAISNRIQLGLKKQDLTDVRKLATECIFPVSEGFRGSFDSLRTASDNDIWLIADRTNLRQCFEGICSLLAFSPKQIINMLDLLRHLNLESRLLSKIASSVTQIEGKAQLEARYTESLRCKAPLIASLAPTNGIINKHALYTTLRSITVFQADNVTVRWLVKSYNGSEILSRAESRRVAITLEDFNKSIYLTKEDINASSPPLELVENLLEFCGIHDAAQPPILQQILLNSDIVSSTEMLERRGITVDFYDAAAPTASKREGEDIVNRPLHMPFIESLPSTSEQRTAQEQSYDFLLSTTGTSAVASVLFDKNPLTSEYALGSGKISTMVTSLDSQVRGNRGEHDWADRNSVYTSSTIPGVQKYIEKLAADLFANAFSELPDDETLKRVSNSLPSLLQGFALRLGGENQVAINREIMAFVHKKREEIAASFQKCYSQEKEHIENSRNRACGNMPQDEIISRWQVDEEMLENPNFEALPPVPDIPFLDEVQFGSDDSGDVDDIESSNMPKYGDIVANSSAYQWLLTRLHREVILMSPGYTGMHAISAEIRQRLYSQPENRLVSSRRGPPVCKMAFQSDWNPLAFVHEQEYLEEPGEAIEGAITITGGLNGDVEAMLCSEYLCRTWPLFGEDFMRLVKDVVRTKLGSRCLVTLFDGTQLIAMAQPGDFLVEVIGVLDTIVEVGEMFAWMTTALRCAPGDTAVSVIPVVDTSSREDEDITSKVSILQHKAADIPPSTGQCWQDLFRNPVVVLGFPVRRRSGQEPGLEIPFSTLAMLVGIRRIADFGGKIFLKGFCTILIPTKHTGDMVIWHVIFNQNGSRISYADARVREIAGDHDLRKYLSVSVVEAARHVVGWCASVKNYAGAKDATYAIGTTLLKPPGPGFAFDRVSISGGKVISLSLSGVLGKKDKPIRKGRQTDYYKQLQWIEQKFVVLFDTRDRRAWVIDGISALLHLVRASLKHSKALGYPFLFKDDDIQEAVPTHTGKAAARAILVNEDNMKLRLYKNPDKITVETSRKSDGEPEQVTKTQTTWFHYTDRVEDMYHVMESIFDHQLDEMSSDGVGGRLRTSPRRQLEGFDFIDVASGVDPIYPKAATLLQIGKGWVDFVRAIRAITLFGDGFGELLEPTGSVIGCPSPTVGRTLCDHWAKLPKEQDLLAVSTLVIQDVIKGKIIENERLWELVDGIYWHTPDKAFEQCDCGTTLGTQCDRAQVLLPTKFPKLRTRGFRSPGSLPPNGAVVFGHSMTLPLIWGDRPGTVPSEGHPQLESPMPIPSDSGLGASLRSLTQEGSSSGVPSVQPAASERALDGKGPFLGRASRKFTHVLRKLKPTNPDKNSKESNRSGDPYKDTAL